MEVVQEHGVSGLSLFLHSWGPLLNASPSSFTSALGVSKPYMRTALHTSPGAYSKANSKLVFASTRPVLSTPTFSC